jgi:hypothetical protein
VALFASDWIYAAVAAGAVVAGADAAGADAAGIGVGASVAVAAD